MKEIIATINFLQDGQNKEYKHTKVVYYTRGQVVFYQFAIENNQFTIGIFQNKVYVYSFNHLKYKLKLQLKQEIENSIQTPYGKLTAYAKLLQLNKAYITKYSLTLKYKLNFSGFEQDFYLHLKEE